jgi:hypothetical protein
MAQVSGPFARVSVLLMPRHVPRFGGGCVAVTAAAASAAPAAAASAAPAAAASAAPAAAASAAPAAAASAAPAAAASAAPAGSQRCSGAVAAPGTVLGLSRPPRRRSRQHVRALSRRSLGRACAAAKPRGARRRRFARVRAASLGELCASCHGVRLRLVPTAARF